jgi:hypothetical protein
MRRRKKKNANTLIKHSQKRIKQRYGLNLREDEIRHIGKLIREKKATFIARQSNNRTIWEVPAFGFIIPVVYDKSKKTIATVLPKDYIWRTIEEDDFFPDYIEMTITQPGPFILDIDSISIESKEK